MTIEMSASDLKQLLEYFNLKTANPCRKCGASSATCCECKKITAWVSRLKTAEAKVQVIPEDVLVLFETFIR